MHNKYLSGTETATTENGGLRDKNSPSVVRRLTVGPTGQDDRAMKPARDSNPESPDVEAVADNLGEIVHYKLEKECL
jgi:hypothetical protein